ncbi:hypothetical protein [Natrialbaceae archaeon AArc-T1-2]|uniref:hypothetical protein n=1 Tax=Natrialbaceae archaeon AArc-T1-2 TaxID=3053904 RepID=UPI00255B0D27|nr:hypothetical protein [Natrialbaceae archaeon AArc-T1-2]WIV66367.1 hypothetical protein QQ977_11785 [Natrialbaceae archaeon AArc-T1-2]
MPDGELVVADTSPLLNLALIGRLDLLREQFDGVTAPEQVWNELDRLRAEGFWISDELYHDVLDAADAT